MPVVAECELHKRIQKAVQLVGRRALALPTEYANKARHADRTYCRTPVGSVGPTEQKLLTFEPVRGLVFGAWGEASPEVSKLLNAMARAGARRHWRGMRCREPSTATGVLAWMLRRRWGLTALRENARLKLDRLEYVGRGGTVAARRRSEAWADYEARLRVVAGCASRGSGSRVARGVA